MNCLLPYAMLLCNFIEDFWVIFHGGLACFVVATGILTDAGAHYLVWPVDLFDELQTTEDEASGPGVAPLPERGQAAEEEKAERRRRGHRARGIGGDHVRKTQSFDH